MRPRVQRNCICHFGEIGWDIGEEVTGSTCCRMGRRRNGNGIWCCRRNLRHGALGDVNGRRWKGRELVVSMAIGVREGADVTGLLLCW